jgi:hypothetical protein
MALTGQILTDYEQLVPSAGDADVVQATTLPGSVWH